MRLLIGLTAKVAQALIGDNEQDAVQVRDTIVRKIVDPNGK